MKTKVVAVLVSLVLFITGCHFINKFMPRDEANLTAPYLVEVEVFIPSSVNVVNKSDMENKGFVYTSLDEYKQKSSAEGSQNYVATFIDGCGCSYPNIKLEISYYSVIAPDDLIYTKDKIPFKFPAGKSLKWGTFYPDGTHFLDIADGRGKICFPMEYHHTSLQTEFLRIIFTALNIAICICVYLSTAEYLGRKLEA